MTVLMPADIMTDLLVRMPDALHLFLTVWLLFVGGCVGSFLNVVVLRVPAGISIVKSGSRCPRCLHAIRWYDNIPVISWLVLRGRCRDCGTPISIRYPLVELLVGALFLVLGFAEGFSAGGNLPTAGADLLGNGRTAFQAWTVYTYHVVLLVTLLAAALITIDGHTVPPGIFVPALAVGAAAPLLMPWLHPVPFAPPQGAGIWGLAVGALAGAAVGPAVSASRDFPETGRTVVPAGALCGAFLGWQAAVAVVAVSSILWLVSLSVTRLLRLGIAAGPWTAFVTPVALLYIVGWRMVVQRFPFCRAETTLIQGAALIVLMAALAVPARWCIARVAPIDRYRNKGKDMPPDDYRKNVQTILNSPSYVLPEEDIEFLRRPELRPVRVQLELLKPELGFARHGVKSTIVVFGGTQIVEPQEAERKLDEAKRRLAESPADPDRQRDVARAERIAAKSQYYEAARAFSKLVSARCQIDGQCDYVIITGGGPGIMEAANRGAYEVGAKSIGLNITLPHEQVPNPYITPQLCFQFHYFALRKMHFLMRAKALLVFPGGFGTLDELFDALTLRQTERMQDIPIILYGKEYWDRVIDFRFLADEGVIADRHLELIDYADSPDEAWEIITRFHKNQTGPLDEEKLG